MDIIHTIIHYWLGIILIILLSFVSYILIKIFVVSPLIREYRISKISKDQIYAYRLKGNPFKKPKYIYAEVVDYENGYISVIVDGKEASFTVSKFLNRFELVKDGYLIES